MVIVDVKLIMVPAQTAVEEAAIVIVGVSGSVTVMDIKLLRAIPVNAQEIPAVISQ